MRVLPFKDDRDSMSVARCCKIVDATREVMQVYWYAGIYIKTPDVSNMVIPLIHGNKRGQYRVIFCQGKSGCTSTFLGSLNSIYYLRSASQVVLGFIYTLVINTVNENQLDQITFNHHETSAVLNLTKLHHISFPWHLQYIDYRHVVSVYIGSICCL
jgi:hypothetical protein